MVAKLIAFWKSLNPVVQGVITLIAGDVVGAVAHIIETPGACVTWRCLGVAALHGLHAGIAAAIALYIVPSASKPKP